MFELSDGQKFKFYQIRLYETLKISKESEGITGTPILKAEKNSPWNKVAFFKSLAYRSVYSLVQSLFLTSNYKNIIYNLGLNASIFRDRTSMDQIQFRVLIPASPQNDPM